MKYRLKVTILGSFVAFFALSLTLGIFLLPRGPYAQRDRSLLDNFAPTAVYRFDIILSPDDVFGTEARFTLARLADGEGAPADDDEGQWRYVFGNELLPVRDERITSFLQEFPNIQLYRTVTSNTDLYRELGFSEVGRRVMLYDANDTLILDIMLGAVDQQRGVYARVDQSETVYLISSELVFYLEQQAGYWQQTEIFPRTFSAQDISSINTDANGILLGAEGEPISDSYQLARVAATVQGVEGQLWQVAGRPEVALDQMQVDNLAMAILALQADSFYTGGARVDFSAADARISFTFSDGTRYAIEIVSVQNSYVFRAIGREIERRSNGDAYLYNANSFSLRPLIQPLSALFPPPLEAEPQQ